MLVISYSAGRGRRYHTQGGGTADRDSAQRFTDHAAAHAYLARWSIRLTPSLKIEEA